MLQKKVEDNVCILTLNDGKTNALTDTVLNDLRNYLKEAAADTSIKGVILTGEGKTFSSGFSLPMFLSFKDVDEVVKFFEVEEEILLELFMFEKPVIAALNGHTVAGGMIFALACDYRILKNHPKIKMGMSEIKIGLPLSVAQWNVVRFGLDSDKKFRDIMYFGNMFGPEQALQLGIIDELVDEDKLISRAKELINLWKNNPGNAFTPLKLCVRKETAERIRKELQEGNMKKELKCFFDENVRKTLEFVQAAMSK